MSNLPTNTTLITSNITGTSGPSFSSIGTFGASSIQWAHPDYSEVMFINDSSLHVKGTIKMQNGDILDERLERIEALLEIPTRDLEMEREFPKLRALWNAYTEELEKYKIWKKIKDSK